jgi:hypothetical protein
MTKAGVSVPHAQLYWFHTVGVDTAAVKRLQRLKLAVVQL